MKKLYTILIYCMYISVTTAQVDHPESDFVLQHISNQTIEKTQVFITDHYTSQNITHTYFKDVINGIPVYNSRGSLHYKSKDNVVVKNNLILEVGTDKVSNNPALSARQVIIKIAEKLEIENVVITEKSSRKGIQRIQQFTASGLALNTITANLQFFYMGKNDLRLIWEIPVENVQLGTYIDYLIDANTGEILKEVSWTDQCNFGECASKCSHDHGESVKETSSVEENVVANSYNVFPWPIENPYYGSRSIVVEPWLDNATASPNGWHAVGSNSYTTSQGNNTDTYLDADNTNFPTNGDDDRALGGATLDFNFPLDTDEDPADYIDAAITNTFYWTNIMHDVWYNYGFDEASGNFQEENYTVSGNASDLVYSEVQDGSGTCNANFSTPPDGTNPRMQMYLCNGNDGDYDNVVIAHEFGHGISNRLTGGPAASGCLSNQEQMGEGWSDYFGIVMTIEFGDTETDSRTVGTWLFNQGVNGGGIRPFPYSTDMTVNPMTYDYIKTESVPHGVGSVWSTMLWDLTWAMIDEYGWDADIYDGTGGNNMTMQLVMEGLKIQPCRPGFVDGRDAILQADSLLHGGAHHCLIWEVFANRGLGYSASQGVSSSRSDGIEAFDMPPSCALDIEKKTTAVELFPGDQLTYEIITKNNFSGLDLTDIVVSDTIPFQTNFVSATSGGVYDGIKVSFPPRDINAGLKDTVSITLEVKSNLTYIQSDFYDDMESGTLPWNPTATGSTSWAQATTESNSGTTSWFAADAGSPGVANLDFASAIGIGADANLTFTHKYDTEAEWDGGLVLLSTDGGQTWDNLGPEFIVNGYNNTIYNSYPGFSGDSGGFITSVINLNKYANNNVIVRFQMICDQAVAGNGWWIDDIILTDTKNILTNRAIAYSDTMTAKDDANYVLLLPDPSAFQLTTSVTNISCNGQDDGSISISPQGGSGSYTYTWNDSETTATRMDLSPDIYSVTVSDGVEDDIIKYFNIYEPDEIQLFVSSTPILTEGGSEGTATANAPGGSGPIMYLWSTGSDSTTIVDQPAGVYSVQVTDENGCSKTQSVTIEDPFSCTQQLLRINVQLDQYPEEFSYELTDDNGQTIGQGGPFNDVPDGHFFIEFFCVQNGCYSLNLIDDYGDGICAGNSFPQGYVELIDAKANQLLWDTCNIGSGATFNFCVPGTSNMILNKTYSDISCDGISGGDIDVSDIMGNYGDINYSWSNGSTEAVLTDLDAGIYYVTISDYYETFIDTTEILGAGNSMVRESMDGAPNSLRDIIANGCGTDTIYFDMDLIGDTLLITNGQISISGKKVIKGPGQNVLTLDALGNQRLFIVEPTALFHVNDIKLVNGEASPDGGAILNNGFLILERTTLEGNSENSIPKALTNSSSGTLTIRENNDIKE